MLTKQFFDKVQTMSIAWNELKHLFDMRVEEKYGYHYSDEDIDEIIDCIDYGNGSISFEEFDEIMRRNGEGKHE